MQFNQFFDFFQGLAVLNLHYCVEHDKNCIEHDKRNENMQR